MYHELKIALEAAIKYINKVINNYDLSPDEIRGLEKTRIEVSSYIAKLEIEESKVKDSGNELNISEDVLNEMRRKTTDAILYAKTIEKEHKKVNEKENISEPIVNKENNARKVVKVNDIAICDIDNDVTEYSFSKPTKVNDEKLDNKSNDSMDSSANQKMDDEQAKKTVDKAVNGEPSSENTESYGDVYSNSNKAERLRTGLKHAIVTALVIGIAFGIGRCSKKDKKANTDDFTTRPSTTASEMIDDTTSTTKELETESTTIKISENININNLNIEDENSLREFAIELQNNNPELNDLSIDEIVDAIRLANFDKLQNQEVFYTNEQVLEATESIGKIVTVVGSDKVMIKNSKDDIYLTNDELSTIISVQTKALDLSNFSGAKTENGYDLIKVLEICIDKVNSKDSYAQAYAKIINEIVADYEISFVLCEQSPISALYVVAGLYDENKKAVTDITSGHEWGPRYGYSSNADVNFLDGYYGFICSEEIEDYVKIDGNNDNLLYQADWLNEKLVKGHSKSR